MGEKYLKNRNVLREVSKRRVDTERQNVVANVKQKRLPVFYNELKSSWDKKYVQKQKA
jgi:hypothetical protein